jgi:GMP synthase-like glutamine amidotransferase
MRILAVLHPGGGHSGLLRERADAAGHELVEWTPGAGDSPPGPLADFGALAVFGGGMNVADERRLPWLTGEVEQLRDALARGMPVLGVCLGAQLVARAAGAEVRRAARPEIGWLPVWREPASEGDPVLGDLPERFLAYQWHSYSFELPAGAVALARSEVCVQAFALDGTAWAVQFHPEVTPDIVEGWSRDYESDPDAVALGFDPDVAIAEAAERLPEWNAIGSTLFDGWLRRAASAEPEAAAAPAAAGPPPLRG